MNRCFVRLCYSFSRYSESSPKFQLTLSNCGRSFSLTSKDRHARLQQNLEDFRFSRRNFNLNSVVRHYDKVDLSKENCITYEDFKSGVENDEILVVDVRRQDEVDRGRVPVKRYIHVHIEELEEALKNSDEAFRKNYGAEKPGRNANDIVFFCRLGIRSSRAVKIARKLGYNSPRHYPGGWAVWNEHVQNDPA